MLLKRLKYGLLLLCLSFTTFSQGQALEQMDILISPGYTFFPKDYYPGVGFGAPLLLHADFAVHDLFSFGGYGGMAFRKGVNGKFKAWNLGARATFHLNNFLDYKVSMDLHSEEVDFYISVFTGYESSNYGQTHPLPEGVKAARFRAGPYVGMRYYLFDQFSAFAEAGFGPWGHLNVGVTVKLWVFD